MSKRALKSRISSQTWDCDVLGCKQPCGKSLASGERSGRTNVNLKSQRWRQGPGHATSWRSWFAGNAGKTSILRSLLRVALTANVNLYHVTKFPLYLSFTVHCNYTKIGRFTPIVSIRIGHFRFPPDLCIKTRLSAQPLIWKWFFILMQIKLISITKVVHLGSFSKWGLLEVGSGLLF